MDKLYFVILPEDGVWVAHGLQKNVVTHGESLQEIRENIYALVEGYRTLVSGETLETLPKAEPKYWELFIEAMKAGRDLDTYLATPVPDAKDSYGLELQTA